MAEHADRSLASEIAFSGPQTGQAVDAAGTYPGQVQGRLQAL